MSNSKSSEEEENKKIVDSAIDATEQPTEQPQQQQQQKTVTIPLDQYQALMSANLTSHINTLNTLDDIDKIIASMTNVQIFAMNIKEKIKKNQLALNQPDQQQPKQQQLTDNSNAQ